MKLVLKFIFLGFFALLYGIIITIRNKLYDWHVFHSTEFPFPVISVGNITVGGTGKTPHTEMLLSMLKSQMNVATLSRGYKRKTKNFRYVSETDVVATVGDEPLQIKQKFSDTTVAVNVNRVEGINRLINDDKELNVVILDDAFQYRKIRPSLSIVLMDYTQPIYHDYLLPVGRLRDRRNQLHRADIVFVTKCPSSLSPIQQRILAKEMHMYPYQQMYLTTFSYGEPQAVFKKESEGIPNFGLLEQKRDANPILLTGIANPAPLVDYLKQKEQAPISHLRFPDHHTFTSNDIEKINQEAEKNPHSQIYTTEKDAVRLREMQGLSNDVRARLFYIPIAVTFLSKNEGEKFRQFILDFVQKNKRNTVLYPLQTK